MAEEAHGGGWVSRRFPTTMNAPSNLFGRAGGGISTDERRFWMLVLIDLADFWLSRYFHDAPLPLHRDGRARCV
jgi:hypothetical protein